MRPRRVCGTCQRTARPGRAHAGCVDRRIRRVLLLAQRRHARAL